MWLYFALALLAVHTANAAPVKLIIDTDIGGGGCNDVDDVLAVSVGHALHDNGEAELLAVVLNTAPVHCAGAISVLNHYYGHDAVSIGAYNVSTPDATLVMQDPLPYIDVLVQGFDSPIKTSAEAEDSVALYRRVLSAQPDRSVTISSIGIHTNLAALLRSAPDTHSPLDGRALIALKVKTLAVMGGHYPTGTGCNLCGGGSNEHNHLVASAASSYVASNWPAESSIVWQGVEVGSRVQTGGEGFQKCKVATAANPVKAAMVSYEHGPNKSRMSWDPLTTLMAVRGAAAVGCSETGAPNGANSIDPQSGANKWIPAPKGQGNQSYLILHDSQQAADAINRLLCQAPTPPAPSPL